MSNKVEIIINAVNKSGPALKSLKDDLDKAGTSGEKAKVIMGKLGTALSWAGVAGAVLAVGNAIKKSVQDWSAYAEEISKAANLSGVTTEEMSRLVQAADDFRVSQDSLKTAMQMALKNGFEPSIENIANLSDELLAIEDPSERAEKASKIFGRQWAEIAPLLLKGGTAIREGTAAIDDNLIVTQESVRQNTEYIQSLDALQDSWTGYKNKVGMDVIPTVTKFIDLLNAPNATNAARLVNTMFKGSIVVDGWKGLNGQLDEFAEAAALADGVGKGMNEMLYGTATASGEAGGNMQILANATNNADAAMQNYTRSLLFKMASEGLSEQEALKLAQSMGLVNEATVTATTKTMSYKAMLDAGKITQETYNALLNGMANAIDRMQDKEIDVTVNTYEHFYKYDHGTVWEGNNNGSNTTAEARASGGPVNTGMPYIVGEEGPELFMPSQPGVIIPNDAITGGSTVTNWNLTINEAGSRGNVAQDFAILKALAV